MKETVETATAWIAENLEAIDKAHNECRDEAIEFMKRHLPEIGTSL